MCTSNRGINGLVILLLISAALLKSPAAVAQPDSTGPEIILPIDRSPRPEGGPSELRESTRYPESAKQKGITGKVIVEYLMDSTGTVPDSSIKVTDAHFQYEVGDSSVEVDLLKKQGGFLVDENSNREIDQGEEVLPFPKLEDVWKSLIREAIRVVGETTWEPQEEAGKPVGLGERHSFPVTFMPAKKPGN